MVSRDTFNNYKEKYKQGDYKDEIEQAHIFYYLVKAGFGADMTRPCFGTGKHSRNRLHIDEIKNIANQAHKRLEKVTIECLSFERIFKTYDSDKTFMYIDSPYRNTKQYATGKFTDEQYVSLYECCKNAKSKWLYTINNDDFIKDLFKEFNIRENETTYSISKSADAREAYKELIITNY